ncbi:MAG: HAD family hydrolase [Vulcanimicrobiaceae bacterium]
MNALIFDCDGVLADTERDGHLPAFNRTFEEFDLPVRWTEAEYGEKLAIGGGKERMASLLTPEFARAAKLPDDPAARASAVAAWHKRKSEIFKEIVASGAIEPRPGVRRLARAVDALGWRLAVASTSAFESVAAVLERAVGRNLAPRFAVFAGDVVPAKKPAPDIYRFALDHMGIAPSEALAIEDSRNGLRAAVGAGIRCLVTASSYTRDEDFSEALLVVSSLGEPDGERATVLANRAEAPVDGVVTVETLRACFTTPALERTS